MFMTSRRNAPRGLALVMIACAALAVACASLNVTPAASADEEPPFAADSILGLWKTEPKEGKWSRVEVYESEDKVHGRIIWLSEPVYGADDPMGMDGQPEVDRNNPDESLQGRPLLDMELMRDFTFNGKNKWEDGRIYDPQNGKTYRCKLTLKDANTLELFGYIKVGFVKLGRNSTWLRLTDEDDEATAQ